MINARTADAFAAEFFELGADGRVVRSIADYGGDAA